VTPTVVFVNFDQLFLTFPPELTLPALPSCQPGNLLAQVTCTSPSHNTLAAEIVLNGPELADSYMVSFKVFNVRNPANTKQTVPFFDIIAKDVNGNQIALYQSVGPTVRNTHPAFPQG